MKQTDHIVDTNKKVTAVEWFFDKLKNHQIQAEHFELYQKAKAMDKEQKLECWNVAHQAGRFEGKGIAEENLQTFEQYYNEKYNK